MPCHGCGARQTDPIRGASPWKRGVRAGAQVLICPECQRLRDWTNELDACGRCGSAHLARALGETLCRDCGAAGEACRPQGPATDLVAGRPGPAAFDDPNRPAAGPRTLAEEVEAALDRLFSRGRS